MLQEKLRPNGPEISTFHVFPILLGVTPYDSKNAAIEKGGADATLEEGEIVGIIRKQIKQRRESMDQFNKAGRLELAQKEESEITLLEKYLPSPLSPEEIDGLVNAAITECNASSRADMGKVMKVLQEKTAGRADGKALSQAVMNQLA